MKHLLYLMLFCTPFLNAQNIAGIQLFNPQTNDLTPVIGFNEQLVLRFDDLSNGSDTYNYTFKHYDRNWQEDGLFFTEIAEGSMTGRITEFDYSFNTLQAYTNYTLIFPNEEMKPKISGNFEIIVYRYNSDEPLFTKRFCVVEDRADLGVRVTRYTSIQQPMLNQRVEVTAVGDGSILTKNSNSIALNVMQNNRWESTISGLKPSATLGSKAVFLQREIAFPGNNEFYYFDNKNILGAFDRVASGEIIDDQYHTYLHPVWAFPLDYQSQGDVNGAFYYRRNDLGIERNAHQEADYSWVYFSLDSEPSDKEIYVLGGFNDYQPSEKSKMHYDESRQQYIAKIYLKQGFYNYQLVTLSDADKLNFGEINGNFWQTENLYQAFLYYRPFGSNYDALLGYGEYRTPIR